MPSQMNAILSIMADTGCKTAIEVITAADQIRLANPGVTSLQLLWPGNSSAAKVTITRVTIEPGSGQPRHSHPASEQIWIIESGSAELLLAGDRTQIVCAGDVVRTPAGETHGLHNGGSEPFVYLAITTPPVDFRAAYETEG